MHDPISCRARTEVLPFLFQTFHLWLINIQCNSLGVFPDTQIFCEILVQRPIGRKTVHLPSRMTAEDLAYMRVMAQQNFDKIMAVLKDMPRPMLLYIRYVWKSSKMYYLNLLRFIDRYTSFVGIKKIAPYLIKCILFCCEN